MPETAAPTSRRERALLADLMDEVGPDAPTLCGDWTTRDLAAHLVLRERRPDAAAGVIVSKLAGYTDKVQSGIAAGDYDDIVAKVRQGPQAWSPTRISSVDRLANTAEFFVHHEDVRRAVDGWEARSLDQETNDELRETLARAAKMMTRKLGVGLQLQPTDTTDTSPITAKAGEPVVTVEGPVGELMLYVYGRKEVVEVTLQGDDEAVATVRAADFGI